MGLFNFFKQRRDRESAIPPSEAEAIVGKLESADTPVGQPIQGAGAPQGFGSIPVGQGADIGSIFGMLGMIKQASQTGNIQISHGEDHVIDLRGSSDGQALRDQIIAAMEQSGIDPSGLAEGSEVDAAQYVGLQQNILEVLSQHGVDVGGGASYSVMPDLDGDGKPG